MSKLSFDDFKKRFLNIVTVDPAAYQQLVSDGINVEEELENVAKIEYEIYLNEQNE